MSVYLHDIPLDEALNVFGLALGKVGLGGILRVEEIIVDENAVGRVLAEPVWALLSSPHYHAAAMDGFAIRAEASAGAMPTAPLTLEWEKDTVYIDTGDALPDWANAVVPIEQVESLDENGMPAQDPRCPAAIRIRAGLPPWSHVRPMGEDMVATQLVLPAGQVLRAVDLGAIAASGGTRIKVTARPIVAILPTGSELVPVGLAPKKGEIIEFNSIVLAAQVNTWGGAAKRYNITPDVYPQLKEMIQQAADECDLVLVNAGSSAGAEDFTARLVQEMGELLVHGVAVRPGHPVILGILKRTTRSAEPGRKVPVVGIPGYPVSAALTGEIFIEPLLAKWLGRNANIPEEVEAILTRKTNSPAGDDDYVRVVAGRVGEKMLAAPLSRGAGVISSLVKADGIVILIRGVQGIEAGTPVQVRLYRPKYELEQTIFCTGSHDMTLDLLAQYLSKKGRKFISSNVGSQGGLVALRRGEAHLAGSHLLDPDTGEYNISYIQQYLPGVSVRLVTWANREQGLIIPTGNPKAIRGLEDLSRSDIRYINRQRGAGTRVLLDYHLSRLKISPGEIRGYDQEEYTHLGVAAAVASGRADVGLGVTSAAQALKLDFIPLFQERYDLVIPIDFANSALLVPLFDLMQESSFRKAVAQFPGYDVTSMGAIVIGF